MHLERLDLLGAGGDSRRLIGLFELYQNFQRETSILLLSGAWGCRIVHWVLTSSSILRLLVIPGLLWLLGRGCLRLTRSLRVVLVQKLVIRCLLPKIWILLSLL